MNVPKVSIGVLHTSQLAFCFVVIYMPVYILSIYIDYFMLYTYIHVSIIKGVFSRV